MNENASPREAAVLVNTAPDLQNGGDTVAGDGHQSLVTDKAAQQEILSGTPKDTIEAEDTELPDAPPPAPTEGLPGANGEEDANSEAETVLTSPVKKREAERQYSEAVKSEKPEEPTLPSLPAVTQVEDGEDDEADAPGSPDDGVAMEGTAAAAKPTQSVADNARSPSDRDDSEPLSDISPSHSSSSEQSSRESSRSRAHSERPGHARNGNDVSNPMKRKHRASSVSWPNKRPSMDVPKRRLRGLHSEGGVGKDPGDRSTSPKGRLHRRAVSTQSAYMDGVTADLQSKQKRRANTQFPMRDPKGRKSNWDESSISSEATSHGKGEVRRPQRGVGRSTSTPGRPTGHPKRHINKYGFTKLAEACENNDLDLVKEWLEKDPEQLEIAEFAHNTPLQIASLKGNDVIVKFLIDQGCKVDCANVDKDTPLIDAAENGHLKVVEILLDAGVDPLRENRKGQQALDVIDDDTDNGPEIKATLREAVAQWNSDDAKQRREAEEEQRYKAGPAKELHFMARTYENLLKLVTNNDRNSVREFLDARVPVDNSLIAAAAKTGDSYLVSMLLAEITEKKAHQKPEKPMLSVLGSSHFEMVKSLTELEYFNPLWKNRQGRTFPEIAEDRHGPNWKLEVELLQRLHDEASRKMPRRSSSPITRRDQGSRRPPPRSGQNSDEEDEDMAVKAKQRKNGSRRLMSRRDMRAASGKPMSDSSEVESSDREKVEEPRMMPPKSPGAKRGVGRPRGNSGTSNETVVGTKSRRSSVSVKKKGDGLPSVDEKMEDATEEALLEPSQAEARADATKPSEVSEEWDLEAEKQKAAVRQQEDAARQAEEAKAAKEAAEREQERKAEEARQLEITRQAEEEAARKTEYARKLAEDLAKQNAALAEETRSNHRQGLVDSLPPGLAAPLKLAHDDNSRDAECVLLRALEAFTPLQARMMPSKLDDPTSAKELFVLNAQVAPLLSSLGLDLLLPPDAPGFATSLTSNWTTHPFPPAERHLLLHALPSVSLVDPESFYAVPDSEPTHLDMHGSPLPNADDSSTSFQQDLVRMHARIAAAQTAQAQFAAAPVTLRWVRVQDALPLLHPALANMRISVRMDMPVPRDEVATKGLSRFEAMRARLQVAVARVWENGVLTTIGNGGGTVGETAVRVRHDK